VNQIGLSRQPFLPLMYFGGKIVSFADEFNIRSRIVRLNFVDQIGDLNFLAHGHGHLVADAMARSAIALLGKFWLAQPRRWISKVSPMFEPRD